jgi:hypothetical protein
MLPLIRTLPHTHACTGLITDGFLPFVEDDRYSVWPIVVRCENLPPWVRNKLGAASVLGVVPGTRNRKAKPALRGVMELVADDFRWLQHMGLDVVDASRQHETFHCHVQLSQFLSDLR